MAEKRNRDRNNDNQNRENPVKSDRQNIGRQDSSEMREDVEDQELRQGSRRNSSQNTSTGSRSQEIDESEE